MRKIWTVTLDGREHTVDVAWDIIASGGGAIRVDGMLVDVWSVGVKFPGVTRSLVVGMTPALIVQRFLDFDLVITGTKAEGAVRGSGGLPTAARVWPPVVAALAILWLLLMTLYVLP